MIIKITEYRLVALRKLTKTSQSREHAIVDAIDYQMPITQLRGMRG